ncbi:MAG: hypothetical protein HY825_12075 [Acidobacteria bacterium]|nr:hypothetical protein [Acidobacteriota bacterium]
MSVELTGLLVVLVLATLIVVPSVVATRANPAASRTPTRALATGGDPAVEPHLLAALARGDESVREVAVVGEGGEGGDDDS